MKLYKYRALDAGGHVVRGRLSAVNQNDLFQQLRTNGMELVDCKAVKNKSGFLQRKITTRDLIQLFIHMEQLQMAGVPLMDSLADLRDTVEVPQLRDIMTEVHRDVSEGKSLSKALSQHPKIFGNIFVSMIESGEETGDLVSSFAKLVAFLKWKDRNIRMVKKAMAYPIFVLCLFICVFAFLMFAVVPSVIDFVRNMNQELPWPTVALIHFSDFCQANWLYMILIPLAVFAVFYGLMKVSTRFRYWYHYSVLQLPVMGNVIRKMTLANYTRTFAALFKSGLEILRCLDTSRKTIKNVHLTQALERARTQIADGASISAALQNTGEFPSLVVRMIKVGEESGNLTAVLDQVADFYETDVDEAVQRMIGMINPTLVIMLGIIILWIAVGVYGPIYETIGNLPA